MATSFSSSLVTSMSATLIERPSLRTVAVAVKCVFMTGLKYSVLNEIVGIADPIIMIRA
jgi:hypothetical protein